MRGSPAHTYALPAPITLPVQARTRRHEDFSRYPAFSGSRECALCPVCRSRTWLCRGWIPACSPAVAASSAARRPPRQGSRHRSSVQAGCRRLFAGASVTFRRSFSAPSQEKLEEKGKQRAGALRRPAVRCLDSGRFPVMPIPRGARMDPWLCVPRFA